MFIKVMDNIDVDRLLLRRLIKYIISLQIMGYNNLNDFQNIEAVIS